MAVDGIFCLEGEWDSDLRDRYSMLPVLELLERLKLAKFIHRHVSSSGEVDRYISRRGQKRYDEYTVLYLAAHGDKGRIHWSTGRSHKSGSTLRELASMLSQIDASGCFVHFGSCTTLFKDEDAKEFVREAGVAAAMGYRKPVDWLESAAFEVVLLPTIANHAGQPRSVLTQLMRAHGDPAKHLDFVVATKAKVYKAKGDRPQVR